jgi:uncharacterized membrane protein YidH (DUF202 family)
MPDQIEELKQGRITNRRVHMANERTFLAWIRTSVAIMAFGFVVEKFALFMKQVSLIIAGYDPGEINISSHKYSAIMGIVIVILGALMGVLSLLRFKKVEKQINEDNFQPSSILNILLTLSVLIIGVFLVIYLINSL